MRTFQPAERIKDLGALGEWLNKRFTSSIGVQPVEFVSWSAIDRMISTNHPWEAVAATLLYSEMPIQIPVDSAMIAVLADRALRPLDPSKPTICGQALGMHRHAIKSHPGAMNKVNVYFDEVVGELFSYDRRMWDEVKFLYKHAVDLYDDQASAWILLAAALRGHVTDSTELALRLILDPVGAKQLTTALKALGANGMHLGAMLVEGTSLQGRATGNIDLREEGKYRTSEAGVASKVVSFDEEDLRASIRRVLHRELDLAKLEIEDVDARWTKRWMWCVNGSHSRVVENHEEDKRVDHADFSHLFRRAYVERMPHNLLRTWSGVSYFTGSVKLEHGKSRALFSCDTVTYINFDHLLRPVERAWRGLRVDLDPGTGGTVGVVNRVNRLRATHPVCVMLDYDDFNSQHALRTQQILFEELGRFVGYDEERTRKLVSSFQRSRVFVEGEDLGYLRGTLMTGHRATSFINSVLNYVYLDLTIPNFEVHRSIHVGDDVFLAVSDREAAIQVIRSIRNSDLRMQPIKQSVGSLTAEFLRNAIRENITFGYVCRSIASIISGNWVGDVKLSPMQGLMSMVSSSWTVGNRAMSPKIGLLLAASVCRISRLRIKYVRAMLVGELAVNNSPCRTSANTRVSVSVVETASSEKVDEAVEQFYSQIKPAAKLATTDYLSNHVSAVERVALELSGSSVNKAMLTASYGKTVIGKTEDSRMVLATRSKLRFERLYGLVLANEAVYVRPEGGLLNKYPIIALLRGVLTSEQLYQLLLLEGALVVGKAAIEVAAYGRESEGVGVRGYIPFGDASNIGRKMGSCIVMCTSPICA